MGLARFLSAVNCASSHAAENGRKSSSKHKKRHKKPTDGSPKFVKAHGVEDTSLQATDGQQQSVANGEEPQPPPRKSRFSARLKALRKLLKRKKKKAEGTVVNGERSLPLPKSSQNKVSAVVQEQVIHAPASDDLVLKTTPKQQAPEKDTFVIVETHQDNLDNAIPPDVTYHCVDSLSCECALPFVDSELQGEQHLQANATVNDNLGLRKRNINKMKDLVSEKEDSEVLLFMNEPPSPTYAERKVVEQNLDDYLVSGVAHAAPLVTFDPSSDTDLSQSSTGTLTVTTTSSESTIVTTSCDSSGMSLASEITIQSAPCTITSWSATPDTCTSNQHDKPLSGYVNDSSIQSVHSSPIADMVVGFLSPMDTKVEVDSIESGTEGHIEAVSEDEVDAEDNHVEGENPVEVTDNVPIVGNCIEESPIYHDDDEQAKSENDERLVADELSTPVAPPQSNNSKYNL